MVNNIQSNRFGITAKIVNIADVVFALERLYVSL